MAHKGDKECIYSSKKACEEAKRLEMGKCGEMTKAGDDCDNWAIERMGERAYCGQHINSIVMRADEDRRSVAKWAELGGRIEAYLAWRAEHPSVWDSQRER